MQAVISRPSEIIIFMDANWNYAYEMSPAKMLSNPGRVAPHLEGGNAVYVDGHAKWRSLATIKTIGSDTTTRCDPQHPNSVKYAYCSRAWNPYIP